MLWDIKSIQRQTRLVISGSSPLNCFIRCLLIFQNHFLAFQYKLDLGLDTLKVLTGYKGRVTCYNG